MTQEEQLQFIEKTNENSINILKSKGHDYAGVDILQNFKQMHQMMSILKIDMNKLEGVHMFYILLKIQRACNLIFSDKTGKNESVDDTMIDLRNYIDLMRCTIEEKRKNSEGMTTGPGIQLDINFPRTPKVGDIVIVDNYHKDYDGKPLEIKKISDNKFCYFDLKEKPSGFRLDYNFHINQIVHYLN